jgi:hypothetical protein
MRVHFITDDMLERAILGMCTDLFSSALPHESFEAIKKHLACLCELKAYRHTFGRLEVDGVDMKIERADGIEPS